MPGTLRVYLMHQFA